jgi:hypothetical protein
MQPFCLFQSSCDSPQKFFTLGRSELNSMNQFQDTVYDRFVQIGGVADVGLLRHRRAETSAPPIYVPA